LSLQSFSSIDREERTRSSGGHAWSSERQRRAISGEEPKLNNCQSGIIESSNGRTYILSNGKRRDFDFKQVRGPRVRDGDQVRFEVDASDCVVVLYLNKRQPADNSDEQIQQKLAPPTEKRKAHQYQKLLVPQQNSQRGYSNLPSSAYHQGVIVRILNANNGFVKPTSQLPPGYSKTRDIFFRTINVRSSGLKPVVGDVIQFTLSTQDRDRPMALQISVVSFKRRRETELMQYTKLITDLLNGVGSYSEESAEMPERYKTMTSRVFLIELLNNKAAWSCLGNQDAISEDAAKLLLELTLLVESLATGMNETFRGVLISLMESKLFNSRNGNIKSMLKRVCQIQDQDMMELFRKFFSLVFKYAPEQLPSIVSLMRPLVNTGDARNSQFLYFGLKQLTKLFGSRTSALDWEDIPLVLTPNELISSPHLDYIFLSPVRKTYDSAEDYLETYFRLLRADCFDSFRTGIRALLEGRLDSRDMKVYINVSLVGIHVAESGSGLVVALRITPQREVQNWINSSRFMFGNLLLISPSGNFRDGILATVSTRDAEILKKHQIIFVELCGASIGVDDFTALKSLTHNSDRMIMVECPTYFRAYHPVLRALQMKKPSELPFQEQLVRGQTPENVLPDYIDESELITMEKSVVPTLDIYQERALKYAFRNEIACIQGPPGTGKTYIGIKIVQMLLNMQCKPSSPILVITYKNHALDEFMKEITKITPSGVARVGGRSLEPELDSYSLNTLAKNISRDPSVWSAIKDLRWEMGTVKESIQRSAKKLSYASCISQDTLVEYLSEEQLFSLLSQSDSNLKRSTIEYVSKALKEKQANEEAFLELQNAYQKWCPNQYFITQIEDDYYQTVSIDINNGLSSKENSDNKDDDDFHDDRDIEVIEKHRLVEGGKKQISLNDLIYFNAKGGLKPVVKLVSAEEAFVNRLPFFRLMNVKDLWSLGNRERFMLLQCLLVKQFSERAEEFENDLREYQMLFAQKTELENQHKVEILSSKDVIGMTLVGASINQDILMQVKPAIIIVEEAAEVLESQLISTLGSWIQHLILIGDHQQLRPQVESYTLQKDYNFDLSMMERLIQCQLPYVTLNQQNRMLPEIAELLRDIYPDLESNMERVSIRKTSPSMDKCMFFWTHTDTETKGRSYTNELEAKRAVNLALFLVQQGHAQSTITILSPYQGQVSLLRRLMRAELEFDTENLGQFPSNQRNHEIAIHTVDLYQGDENDIVIVSLVRSNKEQRSGFLKVLNRRCVAQSRARCGMYFIGNDTTLMKEDHWKRFISRLREKDCVGESICLQCKEHPVTKVHARTADDIPLDKTFCFKKCQKSLPCGEHLCQKYCQPPHNHKTCSVQCTEKLSCLHACPRGCYPKHSHNACTIIIDYICSKCSNKGKKMCSMKENEFQCDGIVWFEFPCNHPGKRKCHEDEQNMKCKKPCKKLLDCGHPCDMECCEPCNNGSCNTCRKIKEAEEQKRLELERKRKQEAIDQAIAEANREIEEIAKSSDLETKLIALEECGDSAAEFDKIKRLVIDGMPKPADRIVQVTEIQKIICPELRKKGLNKKTKLNDPRLSDLKFWKGGVEDVDKLKESGFAFKLTKGDCGKGIYVSSNLAKFEVTQKDERHRTIVVEALLGKTKNKDPSSNAHLHGLYQRGYDSLYTRQVTVGHHHCGDEFALPSVDQVIPCYLIIYSVSESPDNRAVNSIELEALKGTNNFIQKFVLLPSRELQKDDPLSHELRIAESQFYRLLNLDSDDLKYKVNSRRWKFDSADYYVNPRLLMTFQKTKETMVKNYGTEYGNYILAFHGTKNESVETIIADNFNPKLLGTGSGDDGWYGAGIYLSEYPQTSLYYGRSLILCRVLPGKSFDMNEKEIRIGGDLKEGYDSHRVNVQERGYGEELVVFNPDQILPYCVVKYSAMEDKKESEQPNKKSKKKKGNVHK